MAPSEPTDPNTPDAIGLTLNQRIQVMVDEYNRWAIADNATAKLDFVNAQNTAKETGQPAPSSYVLESVDAALVSAVVLGQRNYSDLKNVFVKSEYAPPATPVPVVPLPAGYPIGACVTGNAAAAGSIWLALDGPLYPDGTIYPPTGGADPRGQFRKHEITGGPFGSYSSWEKIS
jgi:hypothetical protein